MTATTKIMLTLLLSAMISSAFAAPPSHSDRQGPPPEAIKACADAELNQAVTIETPHGHTLEATCQMVDGALVAVPNDRPEPRR
ncbi:hypothetical protein [Gilvimarinus polysaccharolyticus]|uniref:hypothetical protein n=1 Tax=Gilvimarinus polysaccharolyticus TaxID=863921 RepID=UPI0006737FCD|nr:hypothetical protein [Gilvimarinus polysaccharolyticus]